MELTSRIFFFTISVNRNDHEIGITILRRISSHVHELQNISMSEKYNWKVEIQSPDLQLQRELIFLSISKYKTDRTTSPRFITKYQNIRRQTN